MLPIIVCPLLHLVHVCQGFFFISFIYQDAAFQEALVDWKPITHPVQDRASGFGGLCSLSVFSASTIVMKLIKYLAFGSSVVEGGRGELLFQEYKLDTFTVDRNPNCTFCSK
jgi:hypothetical protein